MKGKLDGSDVIMTSSVKEFRWSNYFAQNRIELTSLINKTFTTKQKWTFSLSLEHLHNNKTVSSNKTCNLFSFCKKYLRCVRAARTWYCDSKVTKPAPVFLWCSARWFVSELRWLISLLIRLSKGGLLSIYIILFPFFIILIIFVFIYSICPLSYLLARCVVFLRLSPSNREFIPTAGFFLSRRKK